MLIEIGLDLTRVKDTYYEFVQGDIAVTEGSNEGRAELNLIFSSQTPRERIQLLKEHDDWLLYAKTAKCTDGVIIEYDPEQKAPASIYIFELKKSIGADTWKKVKTQFEGAGLRALAFCSTVGIVPGVLYFHTAFVHDKTVTEAKALNKQQHIKGSIASKPLLGINKREVREWSQPVVKPFKGSSAEFEHRHIVLQEINGVSIGDFRVESN